MEILSQKEFFECARPGTEAIIRDFIFDIANAAACVREPEISLYCSYCEGERYFECQQPVRSIRDHVTIDHFFEYVCRNCSVSRKRFAVGARFDKAGQQWIAFKYGEHPQYGPPTPSRAATLIGPDQALFFKGRQCENQGLGIGAFVYYRRVVESQKNRILDETLRVMQRLGADPALVAELESAKVEVQFTTAIGKIKHGLPQSLQINGQNPLMLLHSALS